MYYEHNWGGSIPLVYVAWFQETSWWTWCMLTVTSPGLQSCTVGMCCAAAETGPSDWKQRDTKKSDKHTSWKNAQQMHGYCTLSEDRLRWDCQTRPRRSHQLWPCSHGSLVPEWLQTQSWQHSLECHPCWWRSESPGTTPARRIYQCTEAEITQGTTWRIPLVMLWRVYLWFCVGKLLSGPDVHTNVNTTNLFTDIVPSDPDQCQDRVHIPRVVCSELLSQDGHLQNLNKNKKLCQVQQPR